MHSAEWFSLLYKKPPLFLPREKIEEAGKGYRLSLEAPGVYDGNGLPCRVSVARMPLIDETFRVKNSMACCGVSDVKMTTPSCAPNVLHAPRTSMPVLDRKSTRLNSSHVRISYAVFCLKKKKRKCKNKP